jgi:hypothetical protein
MTLEVIRGGKKEPCIYCGQDPHVGAIVCPRISAIWIDPDTGSLSGVEFDPDFFKPVAGGDGGI